MKEKIATKTHEVIDVLDEQQDACRGKARHLILSLLKKTSKSHGMKKAFINETRQICLDSLRIPFNKSTWITAKETIR